MKSQFILKKIVTKTLVSGDKSAQIVLETTKEEDISSLGEISRYKIVIAEITGDDDESQS